MLKSSVERINIGLVSNPINNEKKWTKRNPGYMEYRDKSVHIKLKRNSMEETNFLIMEAMKGESTRKVYRSKISLTPTIRGGTHRAIKNPKISKFSNTSQTLDLNSSNSYLNGTLFGFVEKLLIWPYFGLKDRG